jgi:hypothetical protein
MSTAPGIFALCLLAIDGTRQHESAAISYEVRVVKIKGLEWRGDFFARLQPVANQGAATVWTASRETAKQLAEKDSDGRSVWRATAATQSVVHLSSRAVHMVPSGVNRLADGPFDHATQVAYTPHYEPIRAGWVLSLAGRKLDQGVLVCVVLDNTDVTAVHHVSLIENMAGKRCCDEGSGCAEKAETVAPRIDIPEVAHAEVAGEWLIPNDGALVVSLGVQTVADEAGKALTVERLALVEAHPADEAEVKQASLSLPPPGPLPRYLVPIGPGAEAAMGAVGRVATAVAVPLPFPMPVPLNLPWPKPVPGEGPLPLPQDAVLPPPMPVPGQLPMPMPAMPSRSLPQPVAADGSPLALPPLPEETPPPSSLPGSSEPCATPQGATRPSPERTERDPSSTTAAFTLGTRIKPSNTEVSRPSRPWVLSFPLSAGNLNLEVEVRMASPFTGWAKPRNWTPAQPDN